MSDRHSLSPAIMIQRKIRPRSKALTPQVIHSPRKREENAQDMDVRERWHIDGVYSVAFLLCATWRTLITHTCTLRWLIPPTRQPRSAQRMHLKWLILRGLCGLSYMKYPQAIHVRSSSSSATDSSSFHTPRHTGEACDSFRKPATHPCLPINGGRGALAVRRKRSNSFPPPQRPLRRSDCLSEPRHTSRRSELAYTRYP
jgi:hypothetical protein